MAFSTQGGGALRSEINITPMIDVLLVLIVVVMVVVAMSHEKGLRAEIPQPASKDSPPPKIDTNIVIQIAWAGDKQAPALKINQETSSGKTCTIACSISTSNAPIMLPS